jgi:hypothetical protein
MSGRKNIRGRSKGLAGLCKFCLGTRLARTVRAIDIAAPAICHGCHTPDTIGKSFRPARHYQGLEPVKLAVE